MNLGRSKAVVLQPRGLGLHGCLASGFDTSADKKTEPETSESGNSGLGMLSSL